MEGRQRRAVDEADGWLQADLSRMAHEQRRNVDLYWAGRGPRRWLYTKVSGSSAGLEADFATAGRLNTPIIDDDREVRLPSLK